MAHVWRGAFSLGVAAALAALPAPAIARRIVIDSNEWGFSFEVVGDADNGDVIPLAFPVDFGTGLQSSVTVNINDNVVEGPTTNTLNFSPTDFIFTILNAGEAGQFVSVFLGNEAEQSTPLDRVDVATRFDFAISRPNNSVPGFPTEETGSVGFYQPWSGSGLVEFEDLSSSGQIGDFELSLLCNGTCTDIGFSLNGLNFSSSTFDPLMAPAQLTEFSVTELGSSFRFVFRNPSAVPEPGTWAMMLLGFGAVGLAFRRGLCRGAAGERRYASQL